MARVTLSAAGLVGPKGDKGDAGVIANFLGHYDPARSYSAGPPPDAVLGSDGQFYYSLVSPNLGHDPVGDGNVHWASGLSSSVVSVGSAPSESGNTGDGFLVRSDGTVHRFSASILSAAAWGVSQSGTAAANSTAIQNMMNAIAALPTASQGVKVDFGPGGVINHNGFSCDGIYALELRGAGRQAGAQFGTILKYAGTGAWGISARGVQAFALRGLGLTYSSASFTGDLVLVASAGFSNLASNFVAGTDTTMILKDASGLPTSGTVNPSAANGAVTISATVTYTGKSGNTLTGCTTTVSAFTYPSGSPVSQSGQSDVQNIVIDECGFGGASAPTTARCLLKIAQADEVTVTKTMFAYGAQSLVILGDGQFVNTTKIGDQSTFNGGSVAQVEINGPCQSLQISGCTIEPMATASYLTFAKVNQALGFVNALTFDGANWVGDRDPGADADYLFDIQGSVYALNISGNFITLGGANSTLGATATAGAATVTLNGSASAANFSAGGGIAVLNANPYPDGTGQVITYTGISGSTLTGVSGITTTLASGYVMKGSLVNVGSNGTLAALNITGGQVGGCGLLIRGGARAYGAHIAGNTLGCGAMWDTQPISPVQIGNVGTSVPPIAIPTLFPTASVVSGSKVILTADTGITSGAWNLITWASPADGIPYDWNDLAAWASGAASRLTAPAAGLYIIELCVAFASGAGATRGIGIRYAGSGPPFIAAEQVAESGATELHVSAVQKMAANDFVDAQAFQDSGGSLNILRSSGNVYSFFSMTRVG